MNIMALSDYNWTFTVTTEERAGLRKGDHDDRAVMVKEYYPRKWMKDSEGNIALDYTRAIGILML